MEFAVFYLAVLALPDEVRFTSAATEFVLLLQVKTGLSANMAGFSLKVRTYKAAHADPVGMNLAARSALDLEGVVEGIFLGVIGLEVCHSAVIVSV